MLLQSISAVSGRRVFLVKLQSPTPPTTPFQQEVNDCRPPPFSFGLRSWLRFPWSLYVSHVTANIPSVFFFIHLNLFQLFSFNLFGYFRFWHLFLVFRGKFVEIYFVYYNFFLLILFSVLSFLLLQQNFLVMELLRILDKDTSEDFLGFKCDGRGFLVRWGKGLMVDGWVGIDNKKIIQFLLSSFLLILWLYHRPLV